MYTWLFFFAKIYQIQWKIQARHCVYILLKVLKFPLHKSHLPSLITHTNPDTGFLGASRLFLFSKKKVSGAMKRIPFVIPTMGPVISDTYSL